MKKEIKIEVPNGYEVDKENSTFENIVFKKIKDSLPSSWEELERISGWWFGGARIYGGDEYTTNDENKNIFVTKEQAQASIALAQLSQLREVYRKGWVPDWSDSTKKHCIFISADKIVVDWFNLSNCFLSFQDEKTRDLFLENFRDLIELAKPLLS